MTIPNILTCIRLCLMPVFLSVYLSPAANGKYIAMAILCFSFITDVLDGFIARRFNMISDLGKVLDPLADKVMQITVLICMAFSHKQLVWLVITLLVKDILIGIGALVLFIKKKKVAQANWFGKTSCFLSVICSLVLMFGEFGSSSLLVTNICIGVIAAVNAIAFISYVFDYVNAQKEV